MNFNWFGKQSLRFVFGAACAAQSLLATAAGSLPDIIDAIKPSVLAVGFFKETQSPRFAFRGTGFVAAEGNLLVTNAHVVASASAGAADGSLVAYSRDGHGQSRMRRAELLEVDKVHDLALLRVGGDALPALNLGKGGAVREGQAVAFIGFPLGGVLGFSPVTHRGTVSSITTVALPSPSARQLDERAINLIREGAFRVFQLDATAYPGNSGGPLFDADDGGIIGVLNMVTLKGARESAMTHPSGISYAIPVEFVLRLLAPHLHSK